MKSILSEEKKFISFARMVMEKPNYPIIYLKKNWVFQPLQEIGGL